MIIRTDELDTFEALELWGLRPLVTVCACASEMAENLDGDKDSATALTVLINHVGERIQDISKQMLQLADAFYDNQKTEALEPEKGEEIPDQDTPEA